MDIHGVLNLNDLPILNEDIKMSCKEDEFLECVKTLVNCTDTARDLLRQIDGVNDLELRNGLSKVVDGLVDIERALEMPIDDKAIHENSLRTAHDEILSMIGQVNG